MREHDVPTADGRTLRVREDGDPDGVPVVLHHGTPGSRTIRRATVADAASRGIRLLGFDRAGYGDSTRHPGRQVRDVAADVAAIADHLGLDRVGTLGGSGGGPHALACAALLGGRVVAAVSVAGVAPHDAEGLDWTAGMGEENVEEFAAAREGEASLVPLLRRMREEMADSDPQAMVEAVRTLLSPVDAELLTGELLAEFKQDSDLALAPGIDGWLDDDLAFARDWGFDLADIAVPVLVWHGRQDRFVPAAHGEWLAERIPGVEARIDDDEGHLSLGVRRIGDVHAWLRERVAG